MKSTPAKDKPRSADLAFEIRGLLLKAPDSLVARAFLRAGVNPKNETVVVATSIPAVAHALSVPRRDSSRRLGAVQSKTTKQTQSRRTPVESTPSNDEPRSVDLAFEIRGLCSAPPPTDNASPSGAASPHRTGNQHSGHRKASDSLVAHAFLRAVSPFVATSIPVVAHALSVPRRDSSRRLGAAQSKTTKQTQCRLTPVESTLSKAEEGLRGRSGTAQGSHDFKIGSDPSSYPFRDGNRYDVSKSVITRSILF